VKHIKIKHFLSKLSLRQVNLWGYHQQVSVASYRIWHRPVAILRGSTMTAKDKKNICKKMKVVKKIRDMKNSENSKYEKDNWLTSNKEKLNLFKV